MIQFTPAPTSEFVLQDDVDATHTLALAVGNGGAELTVDGTLAKSVTLTELDTALRVLWTQKGVGPPEPPE